ncbi:MAG: malonic semialdehyde reductase [Pseudolabrys sp.]|nr:malonic semialdehyde reductase [Pseudolabrys sp.]
MPDPRPIAIPSDQNEELLDLVFRNAHTYYRFSNREVPDALLRDIYEATKFGPTSGNGSPMRVVFVKSPEAKARLMPGIKAGNVPKVESAPVVAIFGLDLDFARHFDRLSPHDATEKIATYQADEALNYRASFRNATLQAAYFMIGARAMGLHCGPMSGFHHDIVDEIFFAGTAVKSNFLMNIGYGLEQSVRPRAFRFAFDEVCQIA